MAELPPPRRRAVITRLSDLARSRTIVVAHRGSSRSHPENTLPAFEDAATRGVAMQEFDVQVAGDGQLVCMHDETLDRTTDASRRLGPGALVAQLPTSRIQELDAGSWKGPAFACTPVPTLAQALQVMLPVSIPMIEHKGGSAPAFVEELRRLDVLEEVLLQSFDWEFVAAARRLAPELALGLLGPTTGAPRVDRQVIDTAGRLGVELVHWHAPELGVADAALLHEHGLLVCTYTSDDELSWLGARALGIDAMCTNDPARMQQVLTGRERAAPDRTAAPGDD